jgi:hypothetical protein
MITKPKWKKKPKPAQPRPKIEFEQLELFPELVNQNTRNLKGKQDNIYFGYTT